MVDNAPWWFAIPAGLIITAYVLLSEDMRWGRFVISGLKRFLGVDHA